MPKDYPSVILPPIWREAIEMPPVYPSSAPLVCFQENKKDFRYTFLLSYFLMRFRAGFGLVDSLTFVFG